MHTSTWHFWLWFALLGVLPVVVAWGPWRKGLRVPATVYPWAVGGLLWLHGVWFDPPNNFATLDEYGFFGFWFKAVRPYDLEQNGLPMYALLSLPALFVVPMAMASLRRGQHATRAVLQAIPPLVLGLLLLRGIPDHLVDLLHHQDYAFTSVDALMEHAVPGVLVRLAMAAPGLALGGVLWLRTTREGGGS